MKRSNVLTSRRSFEHRVKVRLEQIQKIESNELSKESKIRNDEISCEASFTASDHFNRINDIDCYFESSDGEFSYGENSDREFSDDENSDGEFSDDNENDDFSVQITEDTLEMKLWKWAIHYNITLRALSELLNFLPPHLHLYNSTLPKDARTLLRTPKSVIIENVPPGKIWHSGLIENLLLLCKHQKCPDTLKLMISIDGIKPSKSALEEFWPIQCAVDGVDMRPFFVRVWLGDGKPPLEEYLRPFVNEILTLLENGLTCPKNGKQYSIEVYMFVADAPARAYLKCIKGHSGYFSCERCTVEGEYIHNHDHVCLVQTNATLRCFFPVKRTRRAPLGNITIGGSSD